ncbi:MAG TPA: type II toxin-antitoxin system PemK/MazF family toxin [Prolixibacteraceae bacterium]|nr:type II toxin-antitoxin system PemK/MazF family toxin [Prolixibacteraceae bacterium]
MVKLKRFDVWQVTLDPSIGSEIRKKRPCVVVSPDETNKYLQTVVVVPLTSTIRNYPTRVNCFFESRSGQLVTDQIRSIDKSRLIHKMGELDEDTAKALCSLLVETYKF